MVSIHNDHFVRKKENEILSLIMAGMELGMILSELKVREEKKTQIPNALSCMYNL